MLESTIQEKVKNLPTNTNSTISNIEQRINTISSNIDTGKNLIASAITSKGTSANGSESFEQLANKIKNIQSGLIFS